MDQQQPPKRPSPNPHGRPTKCTKKVRERVCTALRALAYFSEAARYAGVHPDTALRWMRVGRESIEAGDRRPEMKPYRMFYRAVSRAEVEAEVNAGARVLAAKNPHAVLEMMGRRYPDRWGRKDRLDVQGQHAHVVVDASAARAELAKRLGSMVAPPAPQPHAVVQAVVVAPQPVAEPPAAAASQPVPAVARWDVPPDLH